MVIETCDRCGRETDFLVDYFGMYCQDCKDLPKIPKQLIGLRFNRVRFKEKRAFEMNWNKKPYSYQEIHKYFPTENYGVMCGAEVRTLDDDTKDKALIKIFNLFFGETFRSRDHLLFKFDNGHSDKIIFYDKDGEHMGELQGEGTYVVGCGSTHPSGEIYEQKNNEPIRTISYDKFMEVFKDYIKKPKPIIPRNITPKEKWEGDDIKDIPISSVISLSSLNNMGGGIYQGVHPAHGSANGMNFRVDTHANTWVCYRCDNSGGSSPELIAVMEGIIDCEEAGSHCFSEEQGREVIQVAREKYGLRKPEIQTELKPMGWALSINIKKMAERRGMLNCPTCNNPFQFKEDVGFYKCDTCKIQGGLKMFAKLCLMSKGEIAK